LKELQLQFLLIMFQIVVCSETVLLYVLFHHLMLMAGRYICSLCFWIVIVEVWYWKSTKGALGSGMIDPLTFSVSYLSTQGLRFWTWWQDLIHIIKHHQFLKPAIWSGWVGKKDLHGPWGSLSVCLNVCDVTCMSSLYIVYPR